MAIKKQITDYIKQQYTEDKVDDLVDDEICSGNWLDGDWEDDFEDEHEAYNEQGRGEAETAVREAIQADIESHFNITNEQYLAQTDENLWDLINEIHPKLDQ